MASCLIQVFEAWQGLGTRNHTWGAVVDAMDTAGCGQVAQELRAKLMESHDAPDGPPPLSLTPPTQTQRGKFYAAILNLNCFRKRLSTVFK